MADLLGAGPDGALPPIPGVTEMGQPQHRRVYRYTMYPYEEAPSSYYGSVRAGCSCGSREWPCPDDKPGHGQPGGKGDEVT